MDKLIKLVCDSCGAPLETDSDNVLSSEAHGFVVVFAGKSFTCTRCGTKYEGGSKLDLPTGSISVVNGNNNTVVQGSGNTVIRFSGSGSVATNGGVAAGAGGIAIGGRVNKKNIKASKIGGKRTVSVGKGGVAIDGDCDGDIIIGG